MRSTVEQIKERNRTNTYQHLLADGRSKMQEAQKQIADYDKKAVFHATNIIQQRVQEALDAAIKAFTQAEQYGETPEELEQCTSLRQTFQNQVNYDRALAQMDAKAMSLYREALKTFEQLADFQDSAAQAATCRQRIAELEEQEKRNTEERKIAAVKAKKKMINAVIILTPIVAVIIIFVIILITVILPNAAYNRGLEAEKANDLRGALAEYDAAGSVKDAQGKSEAIRRALAQRMTISANDSHSLGLKSNGTVVATGNNEFGQCDVSYWSDIVSISAGYGHTVGLKSDGSVVAVGNNNDGQCDVSDWSDIVSISAGDWHTVGLKSDGTVVAVGTNADGQCDVSSWTDIVAIAAGYDHTVGLKSDGTVVTVGCNVDDQYDVSDWTDIVAIATGRNHKLGLKSDGTVVATGNNLYGQCDTFDWQNIQIPE